jgi:hypothetical protein
MVPIGMLPAGMALPGFTSTCSPETLRRQDVGKLAVAVFDEGDEAGAVRIVFDPLDAGRLVVPGALEVDQAQRPFVAAAAEAHGDAPVVVAPARGNLAGGERLDRSALVERRTVDQHQLALARSGRFVVLECHGSVPRPQSPVVTSMW